MQKKIKYLVWDLKKITIKIHNPDKPFKNYSTRERDKNVAQQRQADKACLFYIYCYI